MYMFKVSLMSFSDLISRNAWSYSITELNLGLGVKYQLHIMGYIWQCSVQSAGLNIACNSKRLGILETITLPAYIYVVPLTLCCSRFLWIFRCICRKMTCNSETAGHRAKPSKIWDSRTVVTLMSCAFDLVVVKAILRAFGALVLELESGLSYRVKQIEI